MNKISMEFLFVAKEPFEDAERWVRRELSKGLSAKGVMCEHCDQVQMRPVIYVELRTLVQKGQLTKEEMEQACDGYCLGHHNEWIPGYIIDEASDLPSAQS